MTLGWVKVTLLALHHAVPLAMLMLTPDRCAKRVAWLFSLYREEED